MNAIKNSIYIFMMFFTLFGFSIGFTIFDEMYLQLNNTYEDMGIVIPEELDAYAGTSYVIKMGMEFLLVLSTVVLLLSSAIERRNLQEYIVGFIGSIILTSVLVFFTSEIYTSIVHSSSTLIDLTIMPEWFITNITLIFFLNVIAGLCTFVFVMIGRDTSISMGAS